MNKAKETQMNDILAQAFGSKDDTETETSEISNPETLDDSSVTVGNVHSPDDGQMSTELALIPQKTLPTLRSLHKKNVRKYTNSDGTVKEVEFAVGEEDLCEMAMLVGYVPGRAKSCIFGYGRFPMDGKGQQHTVTPKDILKLLLDFSATNIGFQAVLKRYRLSYFKYAGLRVSYPAIKSLESLARACRSELFGEASLKPYTTPIPANYYENTKEGRRITPAAAQIMRDESKIMMQMAQINERRSFNPESTSVTNIHIEHSTVALNVGDIMKMPIQELNDL